MSSVSKAAASNRREDIPAWGFVAACAVLWLATLVSELQGAAQQSAARPIEQIDRTTGPGDYETGSVSRSANYWIEVGRAAGAT